MFLKSQAVKRKVWWLVPPSPTTPEQQCAVLLGRALHVAAELCQVPPALQPWAGGGKASSHPPMRKVNLFSFQRTVLSVLPLFIPKLNRQVTCRLHISVVNLPRTPRLHVFPEQLKDGDAEALQCDSKVLLQEVKLSLQDAFPTKAV